LANIRGLYAIGKNYRSGYTKIVGSYSSLNAAQIKGLANFFFDIAKGFVLSGIGLSTIYPAREKFILGIVLVVLALASLRLALSLLKGVGE
jgi:hypothetical protein